MTWITDSAGVEGASWVHGSGAALYEAPKRGSRASLHPRPTWEERTVRLDTVRLDTDGGSLSLDLGAARQDDAGGLLIPATLHSYEDRRRERDEQGRCHGKKYRRTLAAPLRLVVRLDLASLLWMAQRAANSKGGRSRGGALLVTGGKGARFVRVEGWGDEPSGSGSEGA